MDKNQQHAWEVALAAKQLDAEEKAAANQTHAAGAEHQVTGAEYQESVVDTAHTQDEFSVRDKNSGHGKKTAENWNQ